MKLLSLVNATLIKREKRFLALVRFDDGREAWAHCPNPGSMRGNAEAGSLVKLVDGGPDHLAQGRKLRYRWVFVKAPKARAWVCVDTNLANSVVEEALVHNLLPEFAGSAPWLREVSFADARFDFARDKKTKKEFLEIKSVSMAEGDLALFPDSKTERGQKHLKTLMRARREGHVANLLFLVKRMDCSRVAAARAIDPIYADLLCEAKLADVKIFARALVIKGSSVSVGEPLKVEYV